MPLAKETLREIFATHCDALALTESQQDAIKRAMLATAAAQRDAAAGDALAQSGRRKPVCVCGNCAAYISRIIREGVPT